MEHNAAMFWQALFGIVNYNNTLYTFGDAINNMKVYKCGSKAITVVGEIEGIITGINIRFERIQYELSYFQKGEHKSTWLEECEITCKVKERNIIGFKK